ncbi:MAG TPA: hypothetical protein VHY91_08980 [Pirellulales bacterium]|jgi:hypothetical protein|nr:hypothetical protein [Pirellulales bacterium]
MSQTLVEPNPAVPAPARVPRKRPGSPLWRALVAVNFLALIGAAVFLRGWQLGNVPGLNGDEAWLGVQAAHLAAGEPIAWRTPTGNPVNLLLLVPVAALHLVFDPSVAVLRVMALASGVAALAANFWLCRRVFDRRVAMVSTATLAVLPIAIAYSRFAWDASQTILATVLVLYFALSTVERNVPLAPGPATDGKFRSRTTSAQPDWLPALIAFAAAIWIHPTNVFALWLLVVPAVYRYGDDCRAAIRAAWQPGDEPAAAGRKRLLARGLAAALIGMALVAGWVCRGLLATGAARLIHPEQGGLFLRQLVRLFSGGTIFEFIPGPARTSTALDIADVALVSLAGVAALGLVQRLRRTDSLRERCLAWAAALMIGSFFLVAGPEALAPHFERYALCLVAPCSVLLAIGWSHWLGSPRRGHRGLATNGSDRASAAPGTDGWRWIGQARAAGVVLAAAAWLWLAVFYCDYFLVFGSSGGDSHVAFRTAPVEPKLAALEAIEADQQPLDRSAPHGTQRQIWIVADSWWSYWPLAYFATPRRDVHVVAEEQWPAESRQVAAGDAVWRARFVADGASVVPSASAVAKDRSAITICDYSGRPLLELERLTEARNPPTASGD